jgi:ribosomal protein S18 acetylase RimI-like enzyme
LRPAIEGDREFLFRVYASTRAEELAPVPWTGEQKDAFLRMQFSCQDTYYRDNFPRAEFSVIEHGGEPAGRLYLDRGRDEIRVVDIALLPEHRRAGIGTELRRRILAEAAASARPVRIHVERFNPALALYERLGFRRVGDTGVYFFMEWTPAPPL